MYSNRISNGSSSSSSHVPRGKPPYFHFSFCFGTPIISCWRRFRLEIKLISPTRRHVSKFEDLYGMVLPYCGTFEFEFNENFDYMEDCDTEDEEDTNNVANPRETLIKYVNQIRQRFVLMWIALLAPSWFRGIFVPFDLSEAKLKYPEFFKASDFAITEINSEMSGKSYELVKLEKVVRGRPWKKLLTLMVKEVDAATHAAAMKTIQALVYEDVDMDDNLKLLQWRFKQDDENAWYEPPSLVAQYPWLKPDASVGVATDASAAALIA